MAKYKDLVGTAVRDIAGDDGVVTGQLWYNTSENEYRYRRQFAGNAWSSGGNLNTGRIALGAAGTQTAALAFGGNVPPATAATEQYNGSSYSEVNDLNTARHSFGSNGTQTSALAYGGNISPSQQTESWDGTSWTEQNDLAQARVSPGGSGTAVSALAFGGSGPGTTRYTNTEQWTAPLANKTITAS